MLLYSKQSLRIWTVNRVLAGLEFSWPSLVLKMLFTVVQLPWESALAYGW
jgi:hypothetical protein